MAVDQKSRFVAGPPHPLLHVPMSRPVVSRLCREHRYAPQKNLVAKVLVAIQETLLQAYVAEWPPEPVTNLVFFIHSHIGVGPFPSFPQSYNILQLTHLDSTASAAILIYLKHVC